MKKAESAPAGTSGRLRRHRKLRRLHRWLGLGSLAFLLLLSLTGIALNHSASLGLDRHFLAAGWLMAWYGFEVPEPAASFAVAGTRVSLVGNRLYLDASEAARGISALTGAVRSNDSIVAATAESLLYFSAAGELVDRVEIATELPAGITALGADSSGLVVRSMDRVYRYDEPSFSVTAADSDAPEWSVPSAVPANLLHEIEASYRGPGVSLERLLYDLHSGRWLAGAGVWFMDAVGLLLVFLSLSGLVLWSRRKS